MFSGIVENQGRILTATEERGLIRITVEKPVSFDDLRPGDSIACDGVCLTVETFDSRTIQFALGAETLKITGWTSQALANKTLNLERSLRASDRIHGHLVSGHVDAIGAVVRFEDLGGSALLEVRAPKQILGYVWKKGSWAVNGVSLTVNSVDGDIVGMCLIPETLNRTNLAKLKVGDQVNLEVDMSARGLVEFMRNALTESSVMKDLIKQAAVKETRT